MIATLTAVNAETGNQVTTYGYGTSLATSDIASNGVLSSVTYADGGVVSYLVNRQSQVKRFADQRGVVHAYDFDLLGRLIHDRVISFLVNSSSSSSSSSSGGPPVDGTVQRIERTYEVRGMLASVTSYDSPVAGGGNIVTKVQFTYNTFAQLASEYDDYVAAYVSATSHYAYADGSANTIRRTSMTYPSGRVLNYDYGVSGGMDDALSRVASLIDNDGVTHLADYTLLGLDTFVQQSSPQPRIAWSLINGTGVDPYTGLDRFNRVVDNRWCSTASVSSSSSSSVSSSSGGVSSSDLDRIQHGYDRAGNRLWRKNTVAEAAAANLDELYAHDGLERLAEVQRGQLNGSNNAIVPGTGTMAQAWGLDATGNWDVILQIDHTGDTSDNRTHNQANEITYSANRGPITYDLAGNTTELAVSLSSPTKLAYDAWNRAASVGARPLVYDGLGRLAVYDGNNTYYYSDSWQLIEQRVGTYPSPDRQLVWGLRYIDDLVLRDTVDYRPTRLYGLQDANWNMSAIVDSTGTVQERYAFDGYGQPVFMGADFGLTDDGTGYSSQFDWETLFAGYRFSSDCGLYLVRNRWYGSFIGRWLTRDAAGTLPAAGRLAIQASADGIAGPSAVLADASSDYSEYPLSFTNLYGYVSGRPATDVDPLGLWELRCRRLQGVAYATFQRHCWVECDGKSYSLLNKDGTGTPVMDDAADKGKGDVVAKGKGKCDCIAAQFEANKKTYPYDKDDCNSNYYASQLLGCCKGCNCAIPRF